MAVWKHRAKHKSPRDFISASPRLLVLLVFFLACIKFRQVKYFSTIYISFSILSDVPGVFFTSLIHRIGILEENIRTTNFLLVALFIHLIQRNGAWEKWRVFFFFFGLDFQGKTSGFYNPLKPHFYIPMHNK